MATMTTTLNLRANNPQKHAGSVVSVRHTVYALKHAMVAEATSPEALRGIVSALTLWIVGTAATDNFVLEMCYGPVFDTNGVFLPASSSWARVGSQVTLSAANLVAAQTVEDIAYAIRVVRVDAGGVAEAGNFDVYVWTLRG